MPGMCIYACGGIHQAGLGYGAIFINFSFFFVELRPNPPSTPKASLDQPRPAVYTPYGVSFQNIDKQRKPATIRDNAWAFRPKAGASPLLGTLSPAVTMHHQAVVKVPTVTITSQAWGAKRCIYVWKSQTYIREAPLKPQPEPECSQTRGAKPQTRENIFTRWVNSG